MHLYQKDIKKRNVLNSTLELRNNTVEKMEQRETHRRQQIEVQIKEKQDKAELLKEKGKLETIERSQEFRDKIIQKIERIKEGRRNKGLEELQMKRYKTIIDQNCKEAQAEYNKEEQQKLKLKEVKVQLDRWEEKVGIRFLNRSVSPPHR